MYILCRYIDLAIGGMPLEAHNQPVPHASIPLNAAEDAYAAALGDGNLDVAAAIPAPGGVVPAPATLLAPHGRLWTAVDAVPVDAGMNHPQRTARFNFGHEYHEPKTALEYCMMMYPIATINGTLAGTTNNLRTFNRGRVYALVAWQGWQVDNRGHATCHENHPQAQRHRNGDEEPSRWDHRNTATARDHGRCGSTSAQAS